MAELAEAGPRLGLGDGPAPVLALFHTSFNVLGVVLMWPLADRLTRWLGTRFRAREDEDARPRHLDDNVLAVPALAVQALEAEVARMGQLGIGLARDVLAGKADADAVERRRGVLTGLDAAITEFAERLNRDAMAPATSEQLARVLRVERYHETAAEQVVEAAALAAPEADSAAQAHFVRQADALFAHCAAPDATADTLDAALVAMEAAYQRLKASLLAAGAEGRLRLNPMEIALRRFSALRRAAQQAAKAARLAGAAGAVSPAAAAAPG